LHFLESTLAVAFCAVGAAVIVIGNRQFKTRDINNIPIVSPQSKHVIGIFLILVAIVIFLSQFIIGARRGGPRSLRPPHVGMTELHEHRAVDPTRSRAGCSMLFG
jgi:hypothetical protein